tara:strand:+ start:239 stop:484 length:246 start_codon:yes stop_codon:yes gene_type:complete
MKSRGTKIGAGRERNHQIIGSAVVDKIKNGTPIMLLYVLPFRREEIAGNRVMSFFDKGVPDAPGKFTSDENFHAFPFSVTK